MWRSTLVVVCQDLVTFMDLTQGRYAHCKPRHGKQLFNGAHEIHAVAGTQTGASRGEQKSFCMSTTRRAGLKAMIEKRGKGNVAPKGGF